MRETAAAVFAAVCLMACGGQGSAGGSVVSGTGQRTEDADSPGIDSGYSADEKDTQGISDRSASDNALVWADMKPDRSMELVYADQFQVNYYGDACELVTIEGTGRYRVVEEG